LFFFVINLTVLEDWFKSIKSYLLLYGSLKTGLHEMVKMC